MRIKIISIGNKMPDWVNIGFAEYSKRLLGSIDLQLIEIPFAGKRDKNADVAKIMAKESSQMLKLTKSSDYCVSLDSRGKQYSSEQFATKLKSWQQEQPNVSLLIGGPEGLSLECLQAAKESLSLSAMTLPHPLVRVVVAEQIYRAFSIVQGHPYHR